MRLAKADIVLEIRRTAQENGGRPLGRSRFQNETRIRPGDWLRYWPRWNAVLCDAGFEPNELQGRYDDETVIGQLAAEIKRLGRIPTEAELRIRHREDSSFPSAGVFRKFGPKSVLMRKVADYCREHPNFDHVIAVIEPLLKNLVNRSDAHAGAGLPCRGS